MDEGWVVDEEPQLGGLINTNKVNEKKTLRLKGCVRTQNPPAAYGWMDG